MRGKNHFVLIVHFPSVTDDEDINREDIVFDLVDNAIISHPYPVTRPAFEFFIPVGPGVGGQFL